ncbi:hypothetical protein FACS1894204_13840 [Synergistales bacterium]|nr:hypothetical protein FACS1894204_13840 [Synergistales bacterium]
MLNDYNKRMAEESGTDIDNSRQELNEIDGRINKIIQLVSESGISIDTVKDELKRLEERKRSVEGYIQEIVTKTNPTILSEEMLSTLINKSKELVEAGDIGECRKIVSNYIESVTVYYDKVEIKFKVNVPDKTNNTLSPLTSEQSLESLKKAYRKTV